MFMNTCPESVFCDRCLCCSVKISLLDIFLGWRSYAKKPNPIIRCHSQPSTLAAQPTYSLAGERSGITHAAALRWSAVSTPPRRESGLFSGEQVVMYSGHPS